MMRVEIDTETGMEIVAFLRGFLLFYSPGPWTDTERVQWRAMMGADDATTKVMGDRARYLIAKIEGK